MFQFQQEYFFSLCKMYISLTKHIIGQTKKRKKTYYDSTLITSVAQTAGIKKNLFTAPNSYE